jgi:hypothetical protein
MLSPNTTFRKTELGNAEIANRKLGLRAELRRLLILVDGRNNVAKLAAFVRMPAVDNLLFELQSLGVIEVSDGSVVTTIAAPAAGGFAGGDQTLAPTQEQFAAARSAAVRFVNNTLGPGGETLAIKIERTRNAQELRDTVTQVRQSLDRMMGEAVGQRFLDAVRTAATKP